MWLTWPEGNARFRPIRALQFPAIMAFIDFDDKELKRFEASLIKMRRKALPFATRDTVNTAAFQTREVAQDNIRRTMVTRNRWTVGSVKVEKSRTLQMSRQEASVGTGLDYLELQEFGGTKRSKGRRGVPIATGVASGEGENARPRRKVPTRSHRLSVIKLSRGRMKAANRRQRNLLTVKQALETKRKFVYLDLGRRKGIFKVTGSKKKSRVRMVWSMGKRTVSIPANPWLNPAARTVARRMPGIYRKALKKQLIRHRIFKRS